jgi:hypothetical protein
MKNSFVAAAGRQAGFALLMVMVLAAAMILILTASMYRTTSVSTLNQRNNEFNACCSAAEAAAEKTFARMAYDFQSYGMGQVAAHLKAGYYNIIPNEDPYWTNFVFSDAQGNTGRTYVASNSVYGGMLPSAYSGLFTTNAPVYRIVSNAQLANSRYGVVGTAEEDVLLALVPLSTWAIFYNGTLEFSYCAPMVVNGRVQANGPIYVGTTASLVFSNVVSSTTNIAAPNLDGSTTSQWDPNNPSTWNTTFAAGSCQNGPSVTVSLNMTNSHFLIDYPASNQTGINANNSTNAQMLYNLAQMVLVVTNNSVGGTPTVIMTLQAPQTQNNQVPGSDPSPAVYTFTNATPQSLSTNLPFLALTNSMYDQRESKTNLLTQIDVGSLATWMPTNSQVQGKLPSSSSLYPTVLYVADRRNNNANQLPSVRLVNGTKLPANNGLGFTVATMNPLYVQGNYNVTTTAGTSTGLDNTYEVPAALLSDSLTILSPNWTDNESFTPFSSGTTANNATTMTLNAAIVTGTIPSTGATTTTFSGGVHNLPRMLEDWTSVPLYLNTSIIRLWDSKMATNQWKYQGTYYLPPNRYFSFDRNFLNPATVPPGIPCALVPIRFAWAVPPPGVVTNVTTHN